MKQTQVIQRVEAFVKKLTNGDSGHDWSHVDRVRRIALSLAKKEKANVFVVELAALLHDVADWKFNKDQLAGGKVSRKILSNHKVTKDVIEEVAHIVDNISWKNGTNKVKMRSLEGRIVQDADRLEALGAIGIARAFNYGGYRNRPLMGGDDSTVKHLYDKVLKLKSHMNTKSGKAMAEKRDKFVKAFIKEFLKEWAGER